jgi:hypothetical protein
MTRSLTSSVHPRRKLTSAVVAAVILFGTVGAPAPSAGARPPTIAVVHPTGMHPDDAEAVQAAVDHGGTVRLEAVDLAGVPTAFDFGPAAVGGAIVNLTQDVEIIGARGVHPTTIRGGFLPFFGVASTSTRIEGITFDGPLLSAAVFIRSTGAAFVGNHVTGVVGLRLIAPFVATEGRGVKFLGHADPQSAIVGDVVVEGNRFDHMHADLSEAIVFDRVAARVRVVDNWVEDVGGGGVFAFLPGGDLEIHRNTIVPGPGTDPDWHLGNGMQLIGSAGGRYTITRNTIRCDNPIADPILLVGHAAEDPWFDFGRIDEPVVAGNRIVNTDTQFGAITLFGDVDHADVRGNTITGASLYALGVIPFFGGETANGNVFRGNSLTGHTSALVDTIVFSHASDTLIAGNAGTVLDLGQDTVITGMGPVRGGFAPDRDIPDALRQILEVRGGRVPETSP